MSYNRNKNVTMIDDLPDLDENENYSSNPGDTPDSYKKFIRNTSNYLPAEAGMNSYNVSQNNRQQLNNSRIDPNFQLPQMEGFQQHQQYNCMETFNHVKNCPICSKFFKFDSSLYIIIIIVLSIICILLLKRILNV